MKRRKLEKTFLEECEKVPILSHACKKLNLSRQTVYRWMKEDSSFKSKVEEALDIGVKSICDLSKSEVIQLIKAGDFKAIKYWLDNNDPTFYQPRRPLAPPTEKLTPITSVQFIEVDSKDINDSTLSGTSDGRTPDVIE